MKKIKRSQRQLRLARRTIRQLSEPAMKRIAGGNGDGGDETIAPTNDGCYTITCWIGCR